MRKIWHLICSWITPERVSSVWRILFNGAVTSVVSVLTNEKLMDAAFQLSLKLLGLRDSSAAKVAMFNAMMTEWCEAHGINGMSSADLNMVREVAYAAVRSQEISGMTHPS